MMNRSTVVLLWILAALGLLTGAFLLVLGVAALDGDTSRPAAVVLVVLGVVVLAGAAWQVRSLARHRRAVAEFRQAHDDLHRAVADTVDLPSRPAGPVHAAAPSVPGHAEPAPEVRPWHLVVAWLVALVVIAIGAFFLVGGVVGLSGGTNPVVGLLLTGVGVIVLWGAAVYVRGVVRSRRPAESHPSA